MKDILPGQHNVPKIEKHHKFHEFMRIFDEMRKDNAEVSYKQLHKSISRIAPEITYFNVYRYFSRFQNNYLVKQNIRRMELREKKKRIADRALDEIEENPKKLPIWLRIRLGQEATSEELRELGMLLSEKHKQKHESFMEKLLNQARYSDGNKVIEGERAEPEAYLDQQAEGLELPEPNEPD